MPATAAVRAVGRTGRRHAVLAASLVCVLSGLLLQFLIVDLRFGGNWTALFCTGSNFPTPPLISGENIYTFANSDGYDGQMYHYIAHDPLLRTNTWRYLDIARARYHRILLPALAYCLAAGRQGGIDAAYIAVNLMFLFLGAWWLARYLDLLGIDPRWAALFFLAPAVLISLERLTTDLVFTALCVGFALYLKLGRDKYSWVLLALACLTRETGFVLVAATCLASAMERRFARAAAFATSVIPAAAWYWYVDARTPAVSILRLDQFTPLQGIFATLLHPMTYPLSGALNAVVQSFDRVALLGFLWAAIFGVWLVRRRRLRPMEAAIVLWSLLGLCLPRLAWLDCYSEPRVFTPLLIYIALSGAEMGRRWTIAPLLMTMPRVVLQVAAPLLLALARAWR